MTAQIQVRRDQASVWTSNNPTLKSGEFGFEEDTKFYKIGDGFTQWTSLPYAHAGVWLSYTPVLTQGTAIAKTVDYAKYYKVGKLICGQVKVSSTGAGTPANPITLSLPGDAAASGLVVGTGFFYDESGPTQYQAVAYLNSVSTIALYQTDVTSSTAINTTVAAADVIVVSFQYEAA